MAGVPMAVAAPSVPGIELFRTAVGTATGWPGLVLIASYSFPIAFGAPGAERGRRGPRVGHRVSRSGPVLRLLERRGIDVTGWSERQVVRLADRYGYVGLAPGVPVFPDTPSIYAFTVIEEDDPRFAAATFAGSVGRLLVTLLLVGGTRRIV